jgi:radical SAM protein with 4Fe4S-binding SPASM domain
MECPYTIDVSPGEWYDGIRATVVKRRVPLSGSVELTWRCNLRCAHCYITGAESWPEIRRSQKELTTAEFCQLLDQIADAGCLYLLLTGGEPLVREDLWEIYLHAKRRGMLITLFTNGTLLDEAFVEKLSDWAPRWVEITLYGYTQATYERVTGVPGSHARCLKGIDLLLKHDVPLRLKTVVMSLNKHELWAMEGYARDLGLDFRYDMTLNACIDGSQSPVPLRLDPEEIVALEAADGERWEGMKQDLDRLGSARPDKSTMFVCGAGITSFHVDPYGQLGICLMVRNYRYDLRAGSFQDGWQGHLKETRFMPVVGASPCHECALAAACPQCPGWSEMESGVATAPVEFLCQLTHLRAEAAGIWMPGTGLASGQRT